MHSIAKSVIKSYLASGKIPTLAELAIEAHPDLETKHLSFVTLYKDGKIIASSGRVHLKRENTILELIDNSLACLKDPRFAEYVKTGEDFDKAEVRVDIIRNEDRRIITKPSDMDPKNEGYIFLSQNLGKLAVLLPGITTIATSPEEMYEIVCKKAEVDPSKLSASDYVLFAIKSTVHSTF